MVTNPRETMRTADATDTRRLTLRADDIWTSVKVFTSTIVDGENPIGEQVTEWLAVHSVHVVEIVIAQSISTTVGLFTIALFYRPDRQ